MSAPELAQLLARWRASYDGALGAQIEALGETLGYRLRLPAAQGEAAAAWTTQLARGRADELTPLLGALDELLARAHGRVCWPCAEALASLPPDPRIGTFALAYIAGTKVPKQMTDKLQRRLFDLVERHGDDRAVSAIEAAIPAYLSITQPRMRNLIAKLEKRIAAAPTQPRVDVPPVDDPRGDELLAAIYADPADDGHRQVYADWLLERSDPRGELISLQLQRAAGATSPRALAREAALIKKHARAWYAAIWSVLVPGSVRFERGFLAACALSDRLRATKAKLLMLRPEWATVESIELHHPVPLSPAMRLRAIRGLPCADLGLLAERGLTRLDTLGVRSRGELDRVLAALASCTVRELIVEDPFYFGPSPLDFVDELAALGARMPTALEIAGDGSLWRKHRWRWASLEGSRLTRFSHPLRQRDEHLVLDREHDAWARMTIHVTDPSDYHDAVDELVWDRAWGLELAHLRGHPFREITIVTPRTDIPRSSLWRLCATLGPVRHEPA